MKGDLPLNNTSETIEHVIKKSNIVLQVLDSRLLRETLNTDIEQQIRNSKKKMLYIVNKCDLVEENTLKMEIQRLGITPYVIVSATKGYGFAKLRERIKILAKSLGHSQINVGVVGYANVGKSSIINRLKRKIVAKVSPRAGYTRGLHRIRLSRGITLIDTPGDLGSREIDQSSKAKIGIIAIDKIKDPDVAAADLIDSLNGRIEAHFDLDKGFYAHSFEVLEALALKFHMLKKGGKLDIDRVSRMIIRQWQSGKIK